MVEGVAQHQLRVRVRQRWNCCCCRCGCWRRWRRSSFGGDQDVEGRSHKDMLNLASGRIGICIASAYISTLHNKIQSREIANSPLILSIRIHLPNAFHFPPPTIIATGRQLARDRLTRRVDEQLQSSR